MVSSEVAIGFTKFPNELMHKILISGLTLRETKILLAIVRFTYGFHQEEAELSVRFLSKATNIEFTHIAKTLKELEKKNIVLVSQNDASGKDRVLSINKQFESWIIESDQKSNSNQISHYSVPNSGTNKVTESVTKKENNKENIKDWFEQFWLSYPKKVAKLKAYKSFTKVCGDESTFKNLMGGLNVQVNLKQWLQNDGKFIPHAATWLNNERWKDEFTSEDFANKEIYSI